MRITHITLKQFRNYDKLELFVQKNLLFFLGDNAQGKTNLLEALYYASTIRSFRTSNDFEMIQFNKEFSKINIEFQRSQQNTELCVIVNKDGKYIQLDGNPVSKISTVVGQLNAVLFCPMDMKLLFTSPRERRKFLDMELGKISTKYMNDLLIFQKLLRERNAYLKQKTFDSVYFDALNERFIEIQIEIMLARNTFIKLLEQFSSKIYQHLSGEELSLNIVYKSCIDINSKDEMYKSLLKKYERNLSKEKEQMTTLFGIHREDFEIYLDDKNVSLYGSQGQKRSCILSLKIGLLEVIRKKIGEYPILLLDDVLSELDEKHRIALFKVIPKEVQTFITSTELNEKEIKCLPQSSTYSVSRGLITKED